MGHSVPNILIAAESMGLGSCWIFFVLLAFKSANAAKLKKELKIPEGYKPFASAAFGYKKVQTVCVAERKPNVVTYIR